jgi:two-component system phosphate regulon response regulator PhoB
VAVPPLQQKPDSTIVDRHPYHYLPSGDEASPNRRVGNSFEGIMGGSILVVDAEVTTRDLLAHNLRQAGYRVWSAGDVPQAEALVRQARPDLVLLDWVLPGTPGLTFARRLRSDQRTRDISIVMLSGRVEEQDKVAALEGGADDYVTKPFSGRELLARIKAVMRRRTPQLADDVIEVAGLQLDPAARRVSAGDREINLWTTEFRLLHFFMTHRGRLYSRARLLDEVWGDQAFIEERTVDVHIRRLRQALAPSKHHSLVETVRGIGYRFQADRD